VESRSPEWPPPGLAVQRDHQADVPCIAGARAQVDDHRRGREVLLDATVLLDLGLSLISVILLGSTFCRPMCVWSWNARSAGTRPGPRMRSGKSSSGTKGCRCAPVVLAQRVPLELG